MRKPALWAWLCLAAWPPDLMARALGWGLMDPGYWALLLLWWPVDLGARLSALRLLLGPGPWRPAWRALTTAFSAEISLDLRFSTWALAGLVPALMALSLDLGQSLAGRAWILGLAGLGLLPALAWLLRRFWAPLEALGLAHSGPDALDRSADRVKGRFWQAFKAVLPWAALSLGLDGLGQTLPEWSSFILGPLAAAALLVPLAREAQQPMMGLPVKHMALGRIDKVSNAA